MDVQVITFGSWMGGDRDGNPTVTAQVTHNVACLARWIAADLYLREVDILRFEVRPGLLKNAFEHPPMILTIRNHKNIISPYGFLALASENCECLWQLSMSRCTRDIWMIVNSVIDAFARNAGNLDEADTANKASFETSEVDGPLSGCMHRA